MRRASGGFMLVEASMTYAVIGIALVALLPVFAMAMKAKTKSGQVATATMLANELLEEIRLHKWDEATPVGGGRIDTPGAIGTEAGESSADKRTFDDIDDFNGWTENPPMDPVMRPLNAFAAYSRSATVAYVDSTIAASASPTDYKLITACAQASGMKPVCVTALATNR